MGRRLQQLVGLTLLCSLAAAQQQPVGQTNLIDGQCVSNYDPNTDYFPEKLAAHADTADLFTVEYQKNYKLIHDNRNKAVYALVQCGTPVPNNLPNGTEVYNVPVKKAAILQTTVVPYLEMLGVADSVTLIADGSFVASSCFQKYMSTGKVTELSSTNKTLEAEQLRTVDVQFGVDSFSDDPVAETSVTTAETYEPDVLGRSSWISYYAAFYNLEGLANKIMTNMTDNYNKLKDAAAYPEDQRPLVAWTMYDAPDQYNNQTASWIISGASYKAGLTQDAGGRFLNGSQPSYKTAEEFLNAVANVDVLIDETYIAQNFQDVLKNYQISDESKYKFSKNKAIFREDGILTQSGGYDWFDTPIAMADALLEDMIHAVNPSAPRKDYVGRWLRNVAKGEPIKHTSADNCTNMNEGEPRPNLATTYQGGKFSLNGDASSASTVTLNVMGITALVSIVSSLLYLA